MKTLNRTAAYVLAFAMILSLLAGCASAPTVTIYTYAEEYDRTVQGPVWYYMYQPSGQEYLQTMNYSETDSGDNPNWWSAYEGFWRDGGTYACAVSNDKMYRQNVSDNPAIVFKAPSAGIATITGTTAGATAYTGQIRSDGTVTQLNQIGDISTAQKIETGGCIMFILSADTDENNEATSVCSPVITFTADTNAPIYTVKSDENIQNGTISSDITSTIAGTTIKVTATPTEGYFLKGGSLKCNGTPIQNYTFTMPNGDATISAVFEKLGQGIQGLQLGDAELLYTDAHIPYTLDGSVSTFYYNDKWYYSATAMAEASVPIVYEGEAETIYSTKSPDTVWDYNGFDIHVGPEGNRGYSGLWIQNVYDAGNGTLIGMCHREDYCEGWYFALGIAKSTDGGKTWIYLGDTIVPSENNSTTHSNTNIGGVPYIIHEDGGVKYLYVYFNEHTPGGADGYQRLAVARIALDQLLKDVDSNKTPVFFKYANGEWNTPGMTDNDIDTNIADFVIPNGEAQHGYYGTPDFHSDATYCEALGKYLITVQTHGANKLMMYSSADGIDWNEELEVAYIPGTMQPYSFFVDTDNTTSTDGSVVGSEFYIYYTGKQLDTYGVDTLYRKKITITSGSVEQVNHGAKYFSDTQGKDGWSYEYMKDGSFADMKWDAEKSRWRGSEDFCLIASDTCRPGNNEDAVRTYTIPKAGNWEICSFGNIELNDSVVSNGVRIKIFKNDEKIWPTDTEWYTIDNTTVYHMYPFTVNAAKDDKIRFIVNCNPDDNSKTAGNISDTTYWDPLVCFLDN